MLSKEECEKAVKDIAYELCRNPKLTKWCQIDGQDRKKLKRGLQRKIDLLKQLINEHFDNREFKEKNFDTVCELYDALLEKYKKVDRALDYACAYIYCNGDDDSFESIDDIKEELLKDD
jgi:hypothetical protein